MKDCKVIGELSENLLGFLSEKKPEFVRRIKNKKIFMWSERLDHIEKHKNDFCDSETFDKYVEMIPEIINKPDVIGIRDKDSSIQFIKEMDDNVLVAVRLNTKGNLSFRTMYPITDSQKETYIRKGTAWVVE